MFLELLKRFLEGVFGRKTRDVLDLSSHWLAVFLVLSLVTLGLKIIYKE